MTQFAANWDMNLAAEFATTWVDRRYIAGSLMEVEELVRVLDTVANFFRRNEPSSPVPMIIDRAKRLIAKDFLAVLEDIAPEALAQAKAAGGIRE